MKSLIKKNWRMTLKVHQKKIMSGEPCRHIQIILPKSLQIWNGGKHHCKHQQDVHHLWTEEWESADGSPGAQGRPCSPRSGGGCCTTSVTRRGREGGSWGVLLRSRLESIWRARDSLWNEQEYFSKECTRKGHKHEESVEHAPTKTKFKRCA